MENYSPLTKMMMDDSRNIKNQTKSKSPFDQKSSIFQSNDVKKEPPQEPTKKSVGLLKMINNYEIISEYNINVNDYYKNIPIYREKIQYKYTPNYDKVLQKKKK